MKTEKKTFQVKMTKSKDFLKISCLSESFSRLKRADDKTAIKIMKIHEIECVGYKRGFFGYRYFYRSSFNETISNRVTIKLAKKKAIDLPALPLSHTDGEPISQKNMT